MKWIFDWKCSLYSLTVCLDSMSPVLLFNFFPLFCHILQQWYFLYLRITGQNTKQNKPIRIPLQLGSLEWNRTKPGKRLQNGIFVVDVHTVLGKAATWTIMEGGMEQFCTFFSPYFQRPHPILTIPQVSLNVGATPDRHNSILVMAKGQFLLYDHSHWVLVK